MPLLPKAEGIILSVTSRVEKEYRVDMILDAGRYDLAPHAQFQILTRVLAEQRLILTVAAEGAKIGTDFNRPSYDCAFNNVDNQPVIEGGSPYSGEDQGDTQSAWLGRHGKTLAEA